MPVFRGLAKRRVLLVTLALSWLPLLHFAGTRAGWWPDGYVRFLRPLWLPVFPAAMLYLAWRLVGTSSGVARARRIASDVAISCAVLSLAALVVGLEIGRPLDRMTVIIAIDRSRSIELVPGGKELIDREVALAREGMREHDGIGVVVFGGRAVTEQPVLSREQAPLPQSAVVPRDATDIDAAIRRALSDVPPDSAARVVLMSDGVATRGETMAGAAVAVAAGVPVDVLPLEQGAVDDVRIVSVRAPTRANAGEYIDLRVVTHAPRDTKVELRVKRDGELIRSGEVAIGSGESVLRVREKLPDAGLHRYDVEISTGDASIDYSADDNAGAAFVRVRGRQRALVLEGDPGQATFIEAALEAAELDVDVTDAVGVPADLGGFALYDLVVLSDIPAHMLSREQLAALAAYVRDFGGGLLLLGGDRGMGPGGYGKTPIEEISPVSFDLKQDERRGSLAEVIAIDISGSMAVQVAGQTKLSLANEAASRAASLLGPGDMLGVEHVDTKVNWSVPLARVGDKAAIEAAIRGVGVGGGGIMIPITLEAGYGALRAEPVNVKHLLLFSDGDDADEIKLGMPLTIAAKADGITTSVIALGRGKDEADLETMATVGGGRYYLVEDATRLPAVFAQETILAARSAIAEDPFHVVPKSLGDLAKGIDFDESPELGGYVVTLPKPRATIHLSGPDDDPILATWPVGVGRAGVFTSDLKSRWGGSWTTWPGAARLLAQVARDLGRRAEDERLRLSADAAGSRLTVRATATNDDGGAQSFRRLRASIGGPGGFAGEVSLEATGPGVYSASVPLDRPGTYVVSLLDEQTGRLVATTGAVLSTGDELRPTGSDHAALERLASFTSGRVRTTMAGIFDDRSVRRFAYEDVQRYLVLASALALLGVVMARKLGIPEGLADWLAKARARRLVPSRAVAQPSATMGALLAAKEKKRPPPFSVAKPALAPPRPPPAAAKPLVVESAPVPAKKISHDDPPPPAPPGRQPTTAEILLARRRGKK